MTTRRRPSNMPLEADYGEGFRHGRTEGLRDAAHLLAGRHFTNPSRYLEDLADDLDERETRPECT